jgi:hypothetical protein
MKKMLLKFADNLLSREQMREVKGGLSVGWCSAYWGCTTPPPSDTFCDARGRDACIATCESRNGGTCPSR